MTSPNSAATNGERGPPSPVEEKRRSVTPPHPAAVVPHLEYDSNAAPRPVVSRRLRIMFYCRLAAFFIIEAAFIALAAACLVKPIPLHIPLRFSDSEVKGGFTVIFILWQSVAVIAGAHLLADAFSREWSVQLARLVPGTTDRVSTVTSGFLDRIIYFFTKRASGTFKLAFMASLCFMALTQLAPGTISAATTLIDVPMTVEVGDLFAQLNTASDARNFLATGSRASLITRLEQIENSSFGLNAEPNWIAAWPSINLGDLNGTLQYDTDVVEFHYDCHWEAPRFLNSTAGVLIEAANLGWTTSSLVFGSGTPASSITPLALTTIDLIQTTSLSAFLFVGGNDTFPNTRVSPPVPFAINLGSLPAAFVQIGVGINTGPGENFVGPLASILICDPRPKISGGRASLSATGDLRVVASGRPTSGNIPPSAANIIFSNGLAVAVQSPDTIEVTNIVNDISAVLFMSNSSVDWNVAHNIAPLDLDSINKNMDKFMLSASKAFSDGYRKDGSSAIASFSLTRIPATGQEQRLALTTSLGLFIPVVVFVAIALVLLYALCRSTLTQSRYPFDLHSVFTVLQDEANKRASMAQGHQAGQSEV